MAFQSCHAGAGGTAAACNSCYGSCCCSSAYNPCHGCPLPPYLSSDFHQHHHHPPPHPVSGIHHHGPHTSTYPSHLDSHLPCAPELHLPSKPYLQSPYFVNGTQAQTQTQTNTSVSALLHRIAALETTIHRRTTTAAPQAPSLRDAAARTIQAHFRTFLVRRSRTLALLKQLASIKSSFGILKSSISRKTHFDFNPIYHKALNLQHRLDSIQGHDPLIRNGKMALSIEFMEFLNFLESLSVDEIQVKSRVASHERNAGNAMFREIKRVNLGKQRSSGIRIFDPADEHGEETDIPIEYVIKKQGISIPRSCIKVSSEKQSGVEPASGKSVSFENKANIYRMVVQDDDDEEEEEVSHTESTN